MAADLIGEAVAVHAFANKCSADDHTVSLARQPHKSGERLSTERRAARVSAAIDKEIFFVTEFLAF